MFTAFFFFLLIFFNFGFFPPNLGKVIFKKNDGYGESNSSKPPVC